MGLLERDALLDHLRQSHAASTRRGRAVFVGGEAGAGKTAVVHAFVDQLGSRANVTVGTCDPLATPRPLAGVADLAWSLGGIWRLRSTAMRPSITWRVVCSTP